MDSQYLYVILFVSFNEILPPFQIIVCLTFFLEQFWPARLIQKNLEFLFSFIVIQFSISYTLIIT